MSRSGDSAKRLKIFVKSACCSILFCVNWILCKAAEGLCARNVHSCHVDSNEHVLAWSPVHVRHVPSKHMSNGRCAHNLSWHVVSFV